MGEKFIGVEVTDKEFSRGRIYGEEASARRIFLEPIFVALLNNVFTISRFIQNLEFLNYEETSVEEQSTLGQDRASVINA